MKVDARKLLVVTLFYLFLFMLTFQFLSTQTFAQQATSSANPSSGESTPSAINAKLEDLKKEIASKAADLKQEVNKRTQNKALIGTVSSIAENTISITVGGSDRTILLNEYTVFENNSSKKTKKTFGLKDILSQDSIVGLGDVDEKGVMTAKKVIKVDPISLKKRSISLGQITSVEGKTIEIKKKDGSLEIVELGNTVVVREGKEESAISAIKSGKRVIAMIEESDKKVSFIYILPVSGAIKTAGQQNEATESGK